MLPRWGGYCGNSLRYNPAGCRACDPQMIARREEVADMAQTVEDTRDTRGTPSDKTAEKADEQPRNRKTASRQLVTLLRPYRGRLIVAALFLVLSQGLGLVFPLGLRAILDTILVRRDMALLTTVVVILLVIFIVQMALSALAATCARCSDVPPS